MRSTVPRTRGALLRWLLVPALALGAAELPEPVKQAMRMSSRLMTVSTYRV